MALANVALSIHGTSQRATAVPENEAGRARTLSLSTLDLRTENEVVEEVSKLWTEAQERFLVIGRHLCRAKARFSGSFEKQIVAALPFGKNVAYQLRMVAEAVDSGRLPEKDLPRSYATAFQLVTLEPPDFEAARTRGLVRNTVTRPEVNAFKRELKAAHLIQGDRWLVLSHERRSLQAEMERLQARAHRIAFRLSEIEAEISPDEREAGGEIIVDYLEPVGARS